MILVTGGAGFIGSNLVDALLENHDQVAVIDDLSTGRKKNLDNAGNKITFHKKSILDGDLKEILRDVDLIFHHAAQMNVRRSVEDPVFDMEVNIRGTLNLIENAPDLEKIIFASSGGAIYGEPEYLPVDEKHLESPICPYGVAKLSVEKYLYYYHYNYGLKNTCLRYANVYGERQDPLGEAGVIAIFINRMKDGKSPVIYGTGNQTRDYVHVKDVVKANIRALKKEGTFNIGTGIETSVNQLVEILSRASGKEVTSIYEEARKGEVDRIALDIQKARKHLKWNPEISLEEGMKKLWESEEIY